MEQRAAQAKAEKIRKPHPPPLIMHQQQSMSHEQQTQHCLSMPGYPTNFYNFTDVYAQSNNFGFNNNNNNSPPAIQHPVQQRATQSAGLQMHGSHFSDFFDQSTVQHPSPPTNNTYNIH